MVSPAPRPAPSARRAGYTARGAEHVARGGRCAGAQTTPVCWRQTSLRARRRRRAGPRPGGSGCRASRPRPPRPRAARCGLCPCAPRPRHAQRSARRAEVVRRRQGAGTVAVTRIPLAGRRGRASPPGAAQAPGGAVPASGLDELPRGGPGGSLPLSLDETCPVSTEGGTRRIQLVRKGGGRAPQPAQLDALVSPRADAPAGASPPPAAAASGPAGSAAAPVSPGGGLGGAAGAPYARSPGMARSPGWPETPAATPGGTAKGSPWQGGGLDAVALGGAGEDPDDGSGGAPAHVYSEEPEVARSAAHAGRLIAEQLLYRCAPARSAGPSVPRAGHFSIIFMAVSSVPSRRRVGADRGAARRAGASGSGPSRRATAARDGRSCATTSTLPRPSASPSPL
jgi:hypothetical protein